MNSKKRRASPEIESDPFGERSPAIFRKTLQIMGGQFHFESDHGELMRLVDQAYSGLPAHRFARNSPQFRVRLALSPAFVQRSRAWRGAKSRLEPPPISMLHGPGLLGAATAASTFVILSPEQRTALLSMSSEMRKFPYHSRYELLEFAVFTLASRALQLVPLHAACIGIDGRGILLMGPTGSGKTTTALHCLLSGFDFLAEDSVFVLPDDLRATGTANYVHVRPDALRWLGKSPELSLIKKSPVIRRRSGITKFEVDLRRKEFRLAAAPVKIVALVFLTSRRARARELLLPIPTRAVPPKLMGLQGYGTSLPQWRTFSGKLANINTFELRRGDHPLDAVEVLRSLLVRG